jgi:hypothetical protein
MIKKRKIRQMRNKSRRKSNKTRKSRHVRPSRVFVPAPKDV